MSLHTIYTLSARLPLRRLEFYPFLPCRSDGVRLFRLSIGIDLHTAGLEFLCIPYH